MQGQTHAKQLLLLQIVPWNTKGQTMWKHHITLSHLGLQDPAQELWYIPREPLLLILQPSVPPHTIFFSVQAGSTQPKQLKRNVSLLCEQPPAQCLLDREGGRPRTTLTSSRADSDKLTEGDKKNKLSLSC